MLFIRAAIPDVLAVAVAMAILCFKRDRTEWYKASKQRALWMRHVVDAWNVNVSNPVYGAILSMVDHQGHQSMGVRASI